MRSKMEDIDGYIEASECGDYTGEQQTKFVLIAIAKTLRLILEAITT